MEFNREIPIMGARGREKVYNKPRRDYESFLEYRMIKAF